MSATRRLSFFRSAFTSGESLEGGLEELHELVGRKFVFVVAQLIPQLFDECVGIMDVLNVRRILGEHRFLFHGNDVDRRKGSFNSECEISRFGSHIVFQWGAGERLRFNDRGQFSFSRPLIRCWFISGHRTTLLFGFIAPIIQRFAGQSFHF